MKAHKYTLIAVLPSVFISPGGYWFGATVTERQSDGTARLLHLNYAPRYGFTRAGCGRLTIPRYLEAEIARGVLAHYAAGILAFHEQDANGEVRYTEFRHHNAARFAAVLDTLRGIAH